MYCCYCGKEIHDEAEICVYCGHVVDKRPRTIEVQSKKRYCVYCGNAVEEGADVCTNCGCAVREDNKTSKKTQSKTALGVIMALFFAVIGLLIGLCMYPIDSEERKTFLNGWLYTFVVELVFGIVVYIILTISMLSYGL